MLLCGNAWLDEYHLEKEERLSPLRKCTFKALRGARRCLSSEELAPGAEAEIGTIILSCANVWQAKSADGLDSFAFGHGES